MNCGVGVVLKHLRCNTIASSSILWVHLWFNVWNKMHYLTMTNNPHFPYTTEVCSWQIIEIPCASCSRGLMRQPGECKTQHDSSVTYREETSYINHFPNKHFAVCANASQSVHSLSTVCEFRWTFSGPC